MNQGMCFDSLLFHCFHFKLTFESVKELGGASIVVLCKSRNDKQFSLLICDKPKHIVMETFIDAYINTYYERDNMICGRYYVLIWPRSMTYYFNDSGQLAYVYFHIVCASKFVMPPTLHIVKGNYPTFEFPNETLQLIKESRMMISLLDVFVCQI
jgi:hypothetical protein